MKAAILTCNTGEGHNAAAKAICEELERRNIDCEVVDTLSLAGKYTSDIVSGLFSKMVTTIPLAFDLMYRTSDLVSGIVPKSPMYYANFLYAKKLLNFLIEGGFDTAICSHLFPAEALTYLRHSSNFSVDCYMVVTDYTCVPFVDETDMDAYFIPHSSLCGEFLDKGLPPQKLIPTGIPVQSKFLNATSKAEARMLAGIRLEDTAFLVMGGGEGCGDFLKLTQKLLEYGDEFTNVIVLTGRNNKLRDEIERRYKNSDRVETVVFSEQVHVFMDACDVMLTKPGGLSSTEAAVKNVPIVHTEPVSGCERQNAFFFSRHGLSVKSENYDMAAIRAVRLANDLSEKTEMLAAQRMTINRFAAEEICDYIIANSTAEVGRSMRD